MTGFSGLYTGLSALIAHRQATEVISHNIANVNTEGYTRQRVDLKTEGIGAVAAVYSRGLNTGQGVRVEGITRIRDDFLEVQYRNESAVGHQLTGTNTVLARLEAAVPEPSDEGISEKLSAFWNSWDKVVNQPDSEAARQGVLSEASALVAQVQRADKQMRVVRQDAVTHIGQIVDQVNSYAEQIASMNDAIKAATLSGLSPNDLLDQRDLLTNKLTDLTGARVETGEYNSAEIYIGGRVLVFGDRAEKLQVAQVADPALATVGFNRVEIQWKIDGYPADKVGGEAAGYVTGANVLAPKYLAQLDNVASQLVSTVNAIHSTGNDLDGVTGRNFFDPAGTTAATLALSADVAGQPRHVAAAASTAGALDTTIAEALAGLRTSPTGADVAYRSLVTGLGTEVSFHDQQAIVQNSVVQRFDQDRKNVSGVNLDEEMVNLVAEQHAYSAAARVITTVDEMLDTLINRTGRVGL